VSDPTPHTGERAHPADRYYQQQLARTLRVAGNLTITLAVIGPAASVFAIGSVALRQQGSGAFLAFLVAALISGCLAVAWDVSHVADVADIPGANGDGWRYNQPLTPCAACGVGTTNRAPSGRPLHLPCPDPALADDPTTRRTTEA
jgi:hypothetical protein